MSFDRVAQRQAGWTVDIGGSGVARATAAAILPVGSLISGCLTEGPRDRVETTGQA